MLCRCDAGSIVFVMLMLITFVENSNFKWDLKSKVIVFGENIELYCHGNECPPETIKKWIGGPYYNLLCFVGYSANSSKYEIMVNETMPDFGIMIKRVTVEDLFCKYTCACGLQQYTSILDLEGVDYIYPPDIYYLDHLKTHGKYHVAIEMNVFPLPTCEIIYEGIVIPLNITTRPTTIRKLGLLNVVIKQAVDLEYFNCNGKINLTCYIGERNYTIIHESIDWCKEKKDTTVDIDLIVIISLLSIVIVGIAIFSYPSYVIGHTIYYKWKGFRIHTPDPPHTRGTSVNQENGTQDCETRLNDCNDTDL